MAMNLVLDFGNTRIKLGLFNKDSLIQSKCYNSVNELLTDLNLFPKLTHCFICSVTPQHELVLEQLKKLANTSLFSAQTNLPIQNCYKSNLTLGSDRIAASVGSFCLYPNQNVLTIDAGTCIKYNFVNSQNQFIGGAISPGIAMRLKSMQENTAALPLVKIDLNYNQLVGENTNQSLLSGALIGTACEIEQMIARYKLNYENLQVVLTGGDADYLSKQLKNRFFTNPIIIIQGLNNILNYNIEKQN